MPLSKKHALHYRYTSISLKVQITVVIFGQFNSKVVVSRKPVRMWKQLPDSPMLAATEGRGATRYTLSSSVEQP